VSVGRDRVFVDLTAPVKPGDGVVFDGDEAAGLPEQGGRVYQVVATRGPTALAFGHRDIDLNAVRPGQQVWKTDDPELTRRLRATFTGPPRRTVRLDLTVRAVVGEPLALEGRSHAGAAARVEGDEPLPSAQHHPTTLDDLRTQLDRLGGTAYHLHRVEATLSGGPLVPRSLLNRLRRELIARLDQAAATPPQRRLAAEPIVQVLRETPSNSPERIPHDRRLWGGGELAVLCRSLAQAEAALAAGCRTITLEFQEIKGYGAAVAALRRLAGNVVVLLATTRIQKPGEANLFKYLASQGADGLLVRNAGGLEFCRKQDVPFVADFSLNAANELTVGLLRSWGAERVTASYDLSIDQLEDLLRAAPAGSIEVVLHQHMPLFHMEHCVFCAFLSPGTDATNCGRPCDRHQVQLRDRVGMEHPLKADVGCRNTLYNAIPQTAAEFLPRLQALGVAHWRVEFLDESPPVVARTLGLYRDTLAGRREARLLWKDLKAQNQYGVTRGPLAIGRGP
jgi:putative protease